MKKITYLIALVAVLLGVMPTMVSADAWNYNNTPGRFYSAFATVNSAISKFEGILHAYSVNQNQKVNEQLFAASDDLSTSLTSFNAALIEIYPSLTEEQQVAVINSQSLLKSNLQTLAAEANYALDGSGNYEVEVWAGSRGLY